MWGNHWAKKKAKTTETKYRSKRVKIPGFNFDSNLEAAVYQYLKLWEECGDIKNLRHHPGTVYLSEAKIGYRPDYAWEETSTGLIHYGEAKGFETDVYKIKLRLWRVYGPGPLHIFKGSSNKFFLSEIVKV